MLTEDRGEFRRHYDANRFNYDRTPRFVQSYVFWTSRYTGKERDSESGNDYFGARYYASSMGRFMSPDWSAKAEPVPYAKLDDPQSLNLYVYVRNNPLARVDLDGHYDAINQTMAACNHDAKCLKKGLKAVLRGEKARLKDLNSKDPNVRAGAAAFGALGENNGVHVTYSNLAGQGINGSVEPSGSSFGNANIQVQIDSNRSSGGMQETFAHEGTHLADDFKFLNSFNPMTMGYDQTLNPTHFQTEFNAFKTGAGVNHEHGFGPNDNQKITDYINANYPARILPMPVFNPGRVAPVPVRFPDQAEGAPLAFGDRGLCTMRGYVIMTQSSVCDSDVCFSRSRFTGKERDAESGNDYFEARYYASSMGRFMSPDWSAKEEPVPYAQMDDPQSLNLYSYVRNNPLSRIDADGHCWPVCTVALGAIAGGLAGAGAEALHEAFQGKGFDGGRIGHAAIGGAIAGAITGLAGPGAGVAATAVIASAGSVIGGGVERQLDHEKVLDGKAIAIDAVAGAVGGAAGKKLDGLIPSVAPGEELTKGAGNSFKWASRNGAEAATENVIRGAVRTGANTAVGTGLGAASNAAKDATQTPKPPPPSPPQKQN